MNINPTIYPRSLEQKIGFDGVRRLICENCKSTLGIELVKNMQFSTDFDFIKIALVAH